MARLRVLLMILYEKINRWWNKIWRRQKQSEPPQPVDDSLEGVPINADKYNSLFITPIPSPDVFVCSIEWEKIIKTVPKNYKLPNSNTLSIFETMKADYYRSIFNTPILNGSSLFVDPETWGSINKNIPGSYKIPNPLIEDIFKVMEDDYYSSIFLNRISDDKVFVDSEIWQTIKDTLPLNYKIPTHLIEKIFEPFHSDSYNSIFLTDIPSPNVFIDPFVWEPIKTVITQDFKIPNPLSVQLFEQMKPDHYNDLFLLQIDGEEIVVDSQIWEQVKEAVPADYKVPNSLILDITSGKLLEESN
ncbi:hypothetical protein BpJC7_24940 [Weizmannia acidilactici]|uniref:Uncharacterized protein n=1 Tax=Weizmannia acidilactici TaxID=2607726 RepID=A0A5J4JHJ6_9BACI|nr:hypothetical protein [Weizmannia acidilactici]GER71191.1 hypothetical protein BpJC7_24940 [Weizmannia acidilactici]